MFAVGHTTPIGATTNERQQRRRRRNEREKSSGIGVSGTRSEQWGVTEGGTRKYTQYYNIPNALQTQPNIKRIERLLKFHAILDCSLNTPGLSRDIQCHVWPYCFQTCISPDQTLGYTQKWAVCLVIAVRHFIPLKKHIAKESKHTQ